MKKTANIAIENKNEASGSCLACERVGLPVFLLRQAVIKTKFNKIEQVNPTYQELANYTKTLDFKHRMPDEELEYYDYVLRTLRNGYVYVMQQQGENIESRILHVYECIDGALRLKNFLELTNTEPRPISKACKNACHNIPASFINLNNRDFTQAWVAYSSQPWPKKTLDDYLKEQDSQVLSRFTKIDIQNLKDSPSDATGKRAVPFKDIFGYSHEHDDNNKSKVLEFRFGDQGLDNFKSAHPFISLKKQRQKFANYANILYLRCGPISCGVVLEDTLGIAEELNSQRVSELHIFCSDAPKQAEPLLPFNGDETKAYQQRGEQMYNRVNPRLKNLFKYYQPDMFKKRTILQLIENYRTSIEDAYDTEIARLQEHYEYLKDINAAYDSGDDFLRKVENEIKDTESEKAKKIEKINQHINHGEVKKFKNELETEFKEITRYYEEWSQDYFTYVRWLFGDTKFVSQYSKIKPTSFNQNHFWQREFDFSNDTSSLIHIKEIIQILIDSTHAEVRLDEDNALWDELLSNPASIFYVIEHKNNQGIDLDALAFIDLDTDTLVKWRDIIDKSTGFASAYNTHQEQKNQNKQTDKEKELQKEKERVELDIEKKQQEINAKQEELNKNRQHNPQEHSKLQKIRDQKIKELNQLKSFLASIDRKLAEMANTPSAVTHVDKNRYLHQLALKKYTVLKTNKQHQPIKPRLKMLDTLSYLGDLGGHPVEFSMQVRQDKIRQVYALLTQLQGSFSRENSLTSQEIAFLAKFDVTDPKYDVGSKKPTTQKLKFTLCFPDEASKSLVVNFLKNKQILNPNDFKNFLTSNMADYVTLINRTTVLQDKIDKVNQQKSSNDEAINESNEKKREDKIKEREINRETEAMNQREMEKAKIDEKLSTHEQVKTTRQSAKAAKLSYGANAISGVVTLLNIYDNLKEWNTVKEGESQAKKMRQLAIDLGSLALLSVDSVAIYRDIKLKMQLVKAMRSRVATTLVPEIEAKLTLNTLISKTVAKAFAAITLFDALGELKSALGMWDMEDKKYFMARVGGAVLLGASAIFLLASSGFVIVFGVIFSLVGLYLIALSKEYDNFTPIDHWLNRCYFGVHKEFAYLGYDAYHEEQEAFVGFGHSVNDYLVALSGIETFIIFKKPSSFSGMKLYHRHLYFYLTYPNCAAITQKPLQVSVKLFGKNGQSDEDMIESRFNILSTGVNHNAGEAQPPIHLNEDKAKETLKITEYVTTDKNYFINRYETKTFKTLTQGKAVWQSNFTDIEKIEVKQTDSNQPGSDLTLITWVAGTFAYDLINNYQINISPNGQDDGEIPLIINRISNQFHEE
ncbi:toxin VasX [Gilliamella sp. WF3-4]|uniref:toxin VasX n=1 Tax=Gilliamella sp. WF3-4 TaxID=3120255 RepID=UPI00080DB962|nr:toxin VasX [Gilliamella apicola]OCG15862.1 hypothetical protein A9G47_02545 [Gilliamella apicola]